MPHNESRCLHCNHVITIVPSEGPQPANCPQCGEQLTHTSRLQTARARRPIRAALLGALALLAIGIAGVVIARVVRDEMVHERVRLELASAAAFWGLTTDQKLVRFSDAAPGLPMTGHCRNRSDLPGSRAG